MNVCRPVPLEASRARVVEHPLKTSSVGSVDLFDYPLTPSLGALDWGYAKGICGHATNG